jgi:hypothetical protein
MYSFAQRSDTAVLDEPFYACYLSKTNVSHPGKAEVLAAQSSNEDEVKQNLFQEHERPILLSKIWHIILKCWMTLFCQSVSTFF